MDLKSFLNEHQVEYTKNRIKASQINTFEISVSISFGKELTEYLVEYGYLAYNHIELYGINSNQMLDSDMVKQTLYLHNYFPKTKHMIALENQGDGDYYLVDSDDCVFEYISGDDKLIDTQLSLFQYILKRFQEV